MNKELKFALELNNCVLIKGWNDAIIGISNCDKPKAVYSISKCISITQEKGGSLDEAEKLFGYLYKNQIKKDGDNAPLFVALNQDLSSNVDFYNLNDEDIDKMYSR